MKDTETTESDEREAGVEQQIFSLSTGGTACLLDANDTIRILFHRSRQSGDKIYPLIYSSSISFLK